MKMQHHLEKPEKPLSSQRSIWKEEVADLRGGRRDEQEFGDKPVRHSEV
jgi:hypothetical protein